MSGDGLSCIRIGDHLPEDFEGLGHACRTILRIELHQPGEPAKKMLVEVRPEILQDHDIELGPGFEQLLAGCPLNWHATCEQVTERRRNRKEVGLK